MSVVTVRLLNKTTQTHSLADKNHMTWDFRCKPQFIMKIPYSPPEFCILCCKQNLCVTKCISFVVETFKISLMTYNLLNSITDLRR